MKYKNVKVLEISPVVYLGKEFRNNDWKVNQNIFKEKVKDIKFEYGFGFECPIGDMINIQIDYKDEFQPLAKESTIDMILSIFNQLLKVFKENVKINLHLDGFIDGVVNSVDMNIKEFVEYLQEEIKEYENSLSQN
ncbi:hypothetical protein P9J83_18200 [Clostridium sporogenes]|uniref:Uncharacterized protein n=1 Tax=Clostridium sporogenes TaxID=1509 RepID=A0AAE4JXU4_CLOSG|nr:hypothetical protein [Clostridium sporogenes]MDS1005392.1 hypothetical protein [Clostridium sporogenes]